LSQAGRTMLIDHTPQAQPLGRLHPSGRTISWPSVYSRPSSIAKLAAGNRVILRVTRSMLRLYARLGSRKSHSLRGGRAFFMNPDNWYFRPPRLSPCRPTPRHCRGSGLAGKLAESSSSGSSSHFLQRFSRCVDTRFCCDRRSPLAPGRSGRKCAHRLCWIGSLCPSRRTAPTRALIPGTLKPPPVRSSCQLGFRCADPPSFRFDRCRSAGAPPRLSDFGRVPSGPRSGPEQREGETHVQTRHKIRSGVLQVTILA